MKEVGRILLTHAHPDDESSSTGGTIAKYVVEGAQVTVVTCTRGEQGKIAVAELAHLAADQQDLLGDRRSAELRNAVDVLKLTDQIKFVIASRHDWDWAVGVIREHRLEARFQCLVSGVFGAVEPIELVGWLLESGLDHVRFQLQLHKYVWHPAMRGV